MTVKLHRPEREIQKAILDYLAIRRVWAMRLNSGKILIPGRKFRMVRLLPEGTPDILCFPKGKVVWLEIKNDKGKQTREQQEFALRATAEGHGYIVARSIADVQREGL